MTQHLDLDALQAGVTALRNSHLSRMEILCDDMNELIDRLRKAEAASVPVEAFDRVMVLIESNAARIIELEDRAEAASNQIHNWAMEAIGTVALHDGNSAKELAAKYRMLAAPDGTPTDSEHNNAR